MHLSARRLATAAAVLAGILVLANCVTIFVRLGLHHPRFFGMNRLFDLDEEGNIPALFSTFLFFVDSALLFAIAKKGSPRRDRSSSSTWWLLAALFLFLGIDENVSIHEAFVSIVRNRFHLGGLFYFAWVIPYGLATLILALFLIPWFCKLERSTRGWFGAAASIFVSGAIGMEMLGGRHLESVGKQKDLTYYLFATVEESLEMTGLIVFAYALLKLLERDRGTALHLTVAPEPSEASRGP